MIFVFGRLPGLGAPFLRGLGLGVGEALGLGRLWVGRAFCAV